MDSSSVAVTSTSTLDGWTIVEYRGLVTAHVVAGTGLFSDIAASFADIFGGRSGAYQRQLTSLKSEVIDNLQLRAARLGANWIVGTQIDFDEVSGKNIQMFMVSAYGTAVRAISSAPNVDAGLSTAPTVLTAEELRTLIDRNRLVAAARNNSLDFSDDATWDALAELNKAEALECVLRHLRNFPKGHTSADIVRTKATRLLSKLPAPSARRFLYDTLLRVPELEAPAIDIIIGLDLVDLDWIHTQLAGSDFRLQRAALQLLRGNALSYTSATCPVIETIMSQLLTAFPERTTTSSKKSLLSRVVGAMWVCLCGSENTMSEDRCTYCSRDRRGLAAEDYCPEEAIDRLRSQLVALRRAFGLPSSESPPI